jgi:hypothetical protein
MPEKTFTLDQARALLPVLRPLLQQAIAGKNRTQLIDEEFKQISAQVTLRGGMELDVAGLARRKAEREVALQQAKDALAELDAIGVQVKDLDLGLLDFPYQAGDRVVLLCWKLGEADIKHWHGTDEGYMGRKPLDQLRDSAEPTRPN